MSDALTYKFQLQDAVKLLNELQAAECLYRNCQDVHGSWAELSVIARDKMRRAGDRARELINADPVAAEDAK